MLKHEVLATFLSVESPQCEKRYGVNEWSSAGILLIGHFPLHNTIFILKLILIFWYPCSQRVSGQYLPGLQEV